VSFAAPENTAAAPSLQHKLAESRSLLGALDAITRWRPFAMLVLTFLTCMLLLAVLGGMSGVMARHSVGVAGLLGLVTLLLVMATALVGINATGIMLSDDTWGRPQRDMVAALLASLFTSHRLIGILLLQGLLFLLYLLAFVVVLFISSIPGIGPLLYAVVFPVGSVLTGILLFALLYVAIPLAAPAVWNGATVMNSLAMLAAIARQRLLFVLVMTLLLGLLLLLVTFIISAILASGTAMTMALSVPIIGSSMDGLDGLFELLMRAAMEGRGGDMDSGYLWALGFGAATLFLLGVTPGLLVGMKGMTIIHRAAIADLSLAETELAIKTKMDEMQRRAREAKEQAFKKAAEQAARAQSNTPAAPAAAAAAAPAPATPPPAAALACPNCSTPIASDDAFCGHCGHKLK